MMERYILITIFGLRLICSGVYDFNLFVVYLTTLSVAQIVIVRMIGISHFLGLGIKILTWNRPNTKQDL
jgi:hypothetical protein